jgi:uncharacterized protein YuzE
MTFSDLTKSFRVTRDTEADAACIYLSPIVAGGVSQTITVDVPHGSINLDIDSDGRVIGIEILHASAVLPESVVS